MKAILSRVRSRTKKVLIRTKATLLRSDMVKRIAKSNPRAASFAKKIAKKIIGANPTDNSSSSGDNDYSYKDILNPDMAINYAEHCSLLQDNKTYWYEKESAGVYKRRKGDPRVVAIYLPQFHPFKENDQAWGKGFTEWTNVTASIPRFVGQQQPVLPSDLGFYDLRLPQIIKEQFDLAKKYGIYGFQFYYYWFSGKKVMDLPINTILKNPDWDFNFSICWANENWTRKWDGGDNEIIFEQKNLPDDPLRFIEDVSPILNDKRYIRENNKPILTVYRVELLDDPKRYVDTWRKYYKENFNEDLWLIGHSYDVKVSPKDFGFDATMDFTPVASLQPTLKPWVDDRKYLTEEFRENRKLLDMQWRGQIIDFRFISKQEIANLENNKHLYKTVSPSWSNEARRKGNDGYTFYNSSPEIFTNWLDKILDYEINVERRSSPIVFVNAWNEWAEAAMIEPSTHLGHNSLNRIAETLSKYSSEENKKAFPFYRFKYSTEAKLAVIIHLYYPDMWKEILDRLKNITVPFDLYISVSAENAKFDAGVINTYHRNTNVVVVPNRGRDVLPFLTIMGRIRKLGNYEYVLKLHTKKSKHRSDGNKWFKDVLGKLLPADISKVIATLSNPDTGSIGPEGHVVSLSRHMGGNREIVKKVTEAMADTAYEVTVADENNHPFFGSTMFWCRLDYLNPLLDLHLMPSDFQAESGQIDCTTAHAIERVLGGVLHTVGNRKMYTTGSRGSVRKVTGEYKEKYKFAE